MPVCLVTGGAGFIGSHLAEGLLERGDSVRILDDLSAGKESNLESVRHRIELIRGSILDPNLVARAMSGIDYVFHLAAMVSVPRSVAEPTLCHEICATGTLNVLLAAKEAGVMRLVFSGSSSCYGNPTECPIAETSSLSPLSPYAAAKLAGEHYCSAISSTSPLETVRLRYFNVFGPRQDPSSPYSGVISIFCTRMSKGERPTLFGDGLHTRDFVFVKDVVRANMLAATTPGISRRVYNIGTGRRITLLDLVAAINRVLGKNLEPQFGLPRAGDVRDSQADIAAARRDLDFDPRVDLDEGLSQCLAYYQS